MTEKVSYKLVYFPGQFRSSTNFQPYLEMPQSSSELRFGPELFRTWPKSGSMFGLRAEPDLWSSPRFGGKRVSLNLFELCWFRLVYFFTGIPQENIFSCSANFQKGKEWVNFIWAVTIRTIRSVRYDWVWSAQSLFVPQVVIISVRLFHIVHSIPFVCLQVFPFPHEIIKIVWPLTKWRRNGGMLTHSHQVHDGQGSPARSSSGLFITDSHSKLDRKLNSQWHICCLFWHLWRSLPR